MCVTCTARLPVPAGLLILLTTVAIHGMEGLDPDMGSLGDGLDEATALGELGPVMLFPKTQLAEAATDMARATESAEARSVARCTKCSIASGCPTGMTCGKCSSHTRSCSVCAAGKSSPEQYAKCSNCPAGRSSAKGSGSCDFCPPGYAAKPGSPACSICQGGSFSTKGAAACTACPQGSASHRGASKCGKCIAGTYTSKLKPGICEHCPPGKFSGAIGATGCQSCQPGRASDQHGAASPNACKSCRPGRSAQGGTGKCELCAAGSYSGEPRAVSCSSCPYGRATGKDGGATSRAACLQCPANHFSGPAPSKGCQECPRGKFAKEASKEASDCFKADCKCPHGVPAHGTNCPGDGQQGCHSCVKGFHLQGKMCVRNQCVCPGFGGVGASGIRCPKHGGEACASCAKGWHLATLGSVGSCVANARPKPSPAVQNVCLCPGGVVAKGACPVNNGFKCLKCNTGYRMTNEKICKRNQCVCSNGTPSSSCNVSSQS